jgi:hypothetical protein
MKRKIVELGHSGERQTMPICDSCADNQIKNTSENRVIPYWIDKYGSQNVDVPQELRDLTFSETANLPGFCSYVIDTSQKWDLGFKGALC